MEEQQAPRRRTDNDFRQDSLHSPRRRRTALVTGASSGIGADLARLLAEADYDLVLVARNEARLRELGGTLAQRHEVVARVVPLDLAAPGAAVEVYGAVRERDSCVDVLVNNAGYGLYGPFAGNDVDSEIRMIHVNVVTLTHLTKLFLPEMLSRGRGRILNVASTAAFMPGPLMAVYHATKAYVLSFSEALSDELSGTGVTVTALCPGPTRTHFQAGSRMEESRLVRRRKLMSPERVAREGFEGLMRGQAVVVPGLKNKLQAALPRFLPRSLVRRAVRNAQERSEP